MLMRFFIYMLIFILGFVFIIMVGKSYLNKTLISTAPLLNLGMLGMLILLGGVFGAIVFHFTICKFRGIEDLQYFFLIVVWCGFIIMSLFLILNFQFSSSKVDTKIYSINNIKESSGGWVSLDISNEKDTLFIFLKKSIVLKLNLNTDCKKISIPIQQGVFGLIVFEPEDIYCLEP